MFTDKSDLLTRINSALEERFSNHKYWNPDFMLLQKAMQNKGESGSKDYLQFLKGVELKKLVERIEKLENQNEQLIYVIHLLFQKVSELAKCIPGSDADQQPSLSYKMCEAGNKERPADCCGKSKPALTKREMDIFNLLSKGLCAKEIAKILFISETTVITHKRNLKEKFRAKNTVELISNVLNRNSG
jgi:DNA-binding CsgD family transcriptional regulator